MSDRTQINRKYRKSATYREWKKRYYSKPEVKKRLKEVRRKWKKENSGHLNSWYRSRTYGLRLAVIARLGGKCSNPYCLVQGRCKDLRCLQIDHIHGGGRHERKVKYNGSARLFYTALLRMTDEELFSNYQLLCANCNQIKVYTNNERIPKSQDVTKVT